MVRSLILFSQLASACLHRTDSHPFVSNPLPAGKHFPEVVELDAYEFISSKSTKCSGVFIRPRLLLTAAHCTYSENGTGVASITYTDSDGVVHKGKMFPSRKYQVSGNVYNNTRYDIALISFDADVAPALAILTPRPPVPGDIVTVVGFGITDGTKDDSGTKRLGYNRIESIDGNISTMTGFIEKRSKYPGGIYSNPLIADSGGGIFNQRGELISIISSARDYNLRDNLGNHIGQSDNLTLAHPESIALLEAIDTDFCAGKSL